MNRLSRPADRPRGENVNPAGSILDNESIRLIAPACSLSSAIASTFVDASSCSRPAAGVVVGLERAVVLPWISTMTIVRPADRGSWVPPRNPPASAGVSVCPRPADIEDMRRSECSA